MLLTMIRRDIFSVGYNLMAKSHHLYHPLPSETAIVGPAIATGRLAFNTGECHDPQKVSQ